MNWVKFYLEYVEFKLDFDKVKKSLGNDVLRAQTMEKTFIEGEFTMYKQIYFENKEYCVHETYFV